MMVMTSRKHNIYVISLPESTERRERLRQQFDSIYDEFEIIHGIRLVDSNELRSRFSQKNHDPELSLPELGCAMTHLIALEQFLQSGAHYAIILEDDVIGTAIDIDVICNIMEKLPNDAFFLCGGQEGLRGQSYNYGKLHAPSGSYWIPDIAKKFYTRACCYCVTVPSAKRIVTLQRTRLQVSDDWNRFFLNWRSFYFSAVISHPLDLTDSNIEDERTSGVASSFLARVKRDGVSKISKRALSKIMLRRFGHFLGFVKIR